MFVDDLNWLKYNTQPWTEVLQRWSKTSQFRVAAFNSGQRNIGAFTLLTDPKMDSLVCKCISYDLLQLHAFNFDDYYSTGRNLMTNLP
jgi:hypothetical protein